jgi:hypothetical protein
VISNQCRVGSAPLYQLLICAIASLMAACSPTGATNPRVALNITCEHRPGHVSIRWTVRNETGQPIWVPVRWREAELPGCFITPGGKLAVIMAEFYAGPHRSEVIEECDVVTEYRRLRPSEGMCGVTELTVPLVPVAPVSNPFCTQGSGGTAAVDGRILNMVDGVYMVLQYSTEDPKKRLVLYQDGCNDLCSLECTAVDVIYGARWRGGELYERRKLTVTGLAKCDIPLKRSVTVYRYVPPEVFGGD